MPKQPKFTNVSPQISPTKKAMIELSKQLPDLPIKPRSILGSGGQSLVIDDTTNSVLIITGYPTAKKMEILRQQLGMFHNLAFNLPTLVGYNKAVAGLLFDKPQPENEKFFKKQYSVYGSLLKENFVFRMPRYTGTVEDLLIKRNLTPEIIKKLEVTLNRTIDGLHDSKLTHNDIASKNIFFTEIPSTNKDEAPTYEFFLGDWGSLTLNDATHIGADGLTVNERKYSKDKSKLAEVISKLKRNLPPTEISITKFKKALVFSDKTQPKTLPSVSATIYKDFTPTTPAVTVEVKSTMPLRNGNRGKVKGKL